jgi:cytochrome c556
MRPKFLFLALPALLALVLVASGCGGGGSSSTTEKKAPKKETVSKLTKAEFISQGDAICGEVNTAVGSVQASAAEPSSQATQIANLYSGMVQSLQRLGQPAEIQGYSDFMGAAEKLAMTANEVKAASDQENPALVEEASQAETPAVEEFEQQAATYGFKDCSEGPHAPAVAPESSTGTEEVAPEEEAGGIEAAPEEEFIPEEEVAPEVEEEFIPEEEVAPETGGAGGEIEEAPEAAPEEGGESGGIGPG